MAKTKTIVKSKKPEVSKSIPSSLVVKSKTLTSRVSKEVKSSLVNLIKRLHRMKGATSRNDKKRKSLNPVSLYLAKLAKRFTHYDSNSNYTMIF
jgi:hypothetical protein